MQITDKPTIEKYYEALVNRNSAFLGTFLVGVKTTGIFCIPTCRARKPKLANVAFFTEMKELLQHGYRPCKICKPTENANEPTEEVQKALGLIETHPKEKIKDEMLRQNGISPETLRRWFQKHYGITFHAYQRMLRINNAYQELKGGKSVANSALENGYESLSGFAYTFNKLVGKAPVKGGEKNIILTQRITTPIGPMFVCATEKGICLLEFVDRKMLETEFKEIQQLLNATILIGENEHIQQTKKELQEYFDGKRSHFEVALDAPGTVFQQSAWNALLKVPFGETRSYQDQAIVLEKPNAVRAVASANGCNRISIIIPCHRIIGKDGQLRGYGGGLERKRWLLDHEIKVKNQ
jgi:AraC family transcriptional regulator, regulatory protein of adaptative response / methylated-DNA-[protein]-cysteine methyltransferase